MSENEKIYRFSIFVEEYDTDGFWTVYDKLEICKGKKQLIKSHQNILNDSLDYIIERLK